MSRLRKLSFVAALVAFSLTLASCSYYQGALKARSAGGPVPWWCTSTEEIPVTAGPAAGNVDWYAGTHKAPLAWDDCLTMSAQFDRAKGFAERWPTRGSAEADGFREVTSYIPGMGTHHVKGGITKAMLADPSFNRRTRSSTTSGSTTSSTPPSPRSSSSTGTRSGESSWASTTTCARTPAVRRRLPREHRLVASPSLDLPSQVRRGDDRVQHQRRQLHGRGGVNVNYSNYYMLHVWVIDDMKFIPDVFAGMIPCISGGGAIHDPTHALPYVQVGCGRRDDRDEQEARRDAGERADNGSGVRQPHHGLPRSRRHRELGRVTPAPTAGEPPP